MVVKYLLDIGCDPNFPDGQLGWTPLMHACAFRHVGIIELLLTSPATEVDKISRPSPQWLAQYAAARRKEQSSYRKRLATRAQELLYAQGHGTASDENALGTSNGSGSNSMSPTSQPPRDDAPQHQDTVNAESGTRSIFKRIPASLLSLFTSSSRSTEGTRQHSAAQRHDADTLVANVETAWPKCLPSASCEWFVLPVFPVTALMLCVWPQCPSFKNRFVLPHHRAAEDAATSIHPPSTQTFLSYLEHQRKTPNATDLSLLCARLLCEYGRATVSLRPAQQYLSLHSSVDGPQANLARNAGSKSQRAAAALVHPKRLLEHICRRMIHVQALHLACYFNYAPVLKYLIAHGQNLFGEIPNPYPSPKLENQEPENHDDQKIWGFMNALMDAVVPFPLLKAHPILCAVAGGNWTALSLIVAAGMEVPSIPPLVSPTSMSSSTAQTTWAEPLLRLSQYSAPRCVLCLTQNRRELCTNCQDAWCNACHMCTQALLDGYARRLAYGRLQHHYTVDESSSMYGSRPSRAALLGMELGLPEFQEDSKQLAAISEKLRVARALQVLGIPAKPRIHNEMDGVSELDFTREALDSILTRKLLEAREVVSNPETASVLSSYRYKGVLSRRLFAGHLKRFSAASAQRPQRPGIGVTSSWQASSQLKPNKVTTSTIPDPEEVCEKILQWTRRRELIPSANFDDDTKAQLEMSESKLEPIQPPRLPQPPQPPQRESQKTMEPAPVKARFGRIRLARRVAVYESGWAHRQAQALSLVRQLTMERIKRQPIDGVGLDEYLGPIRKSRSRVQSSRNEPVHHISKRDELIGTEAIRHELKDLDLALSEATTVAECAGLVSLSTQYSEDCTRISEWVIITSQLMKCMTSLIGTENEMQLNDASTLLEQVRSVRPTFLTESNEAFVKILQELLPISTRMSLSANVVSVLREVNDAMWPEMSRSRLSLLVGESAYGVFECVVKYIQNDPDLSSLDDVLEHVAELRDSLPPPTEEVQASTEALSSSESETDDEVSNSVHHVDVQDDSMNEEAEPFAKVEPALPELEQAVDNRQEPLSAALSSTVLESSEATASSPELPKTEITDTEPKPMQDTDTEDHAQQMDQGEHEIFSTQEGESKRPLTGLADEATPDRVSRTIEPVLDVSKPQIPTFTGDSDAAEVLQELGLDERIIQYIQGFSVGELVELEDDDLLELVQGNRTDFHVLSHQIDTCKKVLCLHKD